MQQRNHQLLLFLTFFCVVFIIRLWTYVNHTSFGFPKKGRYKSNPQVRPTKESTASLMRKATISTINRYSQRINLILPTKATKSHSKVLKRRPQVKPHPKASITPQSTSKLILSSKHPLKKSTNRTQNASSFAFVLNPSTYPSDLYYEGVERPIINVLITSCGDNYLEQGKTMASSLVMSTFFLDSNRSVKQTVVLHIYWLVESTQVANKLGKELNWLHKKLQRIEMGHHVQFVFVVFNGTDKRYNEWKKCASLRLYVGELLPQQVHKIISLDSNMFITQNVNQLWQQFEKFSQEMMFGYADEIGQRYTKEMSLNYTYYVNGTTGFNAGVALLHLKKIRVNFLSQMVPDAWQFAKEKKIGIKLDDQDLMNLIVYLNPKTYYRLPCKWNFRRDTLERGCTDAQASKRYSEIEFAGIVHGNAQSFNNRGPISDFAKLARDIIQQFQLSNNISFRSWFNG